MAGSDYFIETLKDTRTIIDKQLLVLSTAALGFSAHFINNLGITTEYMWLLILSCWSFGITIMLTLCSHMACERHCTFVCDYVNGGANNQALYDKAMYWNGITPKLNLGSLTFLFGGIILFLMFATLTFGFPMKNTDSYENKIESIPPREIPVKQEIGKGYVSPSSALKPPATPSNSDNKK